MQVFYDIKQLDTVSRYLAKFETPDVCGENAVVVYPRLPLDLQKRWDDAMQDHHDGLLTDKVCGMM